jgi:light-regulated signal transduction histidine kinase (bacteriophytochrome)
MDFSKLNVEFANMQKSVEDYNKMINLINIRIKDNLRNISKFETKMKNTKNKLEKDLAHLYITSVKCETEFLESLVKEEKTNERESTTTKTV